MKAFLRGGEVTFPEKVSNPNIPLKELSKINRSRFLLKNWKLLRMCKARWNELNKQKSDGYPSEKE